MPLYENDDQQVTEIPAEVDGVDIYGAYAALTYLTCPWRLGTGICQSGCQTEPSCQTLEPEGGWVRELREAVCGDRS